MLSQRLKRFGLAMGLNLTGRGVYPIAKRPDLFCNQHAVAQNADANRNIEAFRYPIHEPISKGCWQGTSSLAGSDR